MIDRVVYTDLKKILDYEDAAENSGNTFVVNYGWQWHQVAMQPGRLNKYVVKGYIEVGYKSNSATHYLLTDEGEAAVREYEEYVCACSEEVTSAPDVDSLFSDIIGYDDLKMLLRESLQLDKPIHILLHSPPAMAKSLFLWDIERVFGNTALTFLGSGSSLAGMWDLIVARKPRVILIDEIDKMGVADTAALLSLMESGRIIRAKVGREIDEVLNVRVIAAANRLNKMSPELLSRFAKFELCEYTSEEYRQVVKGVLVRYEDIDAEDASEIASELAKLSHDVRDAIRVARLSKRLGVQRAIRLLNIGGGGSHDNKSLLCLRGIEGPVEKLKNK